MAAIATLTLVSMEAASRMFFHSRLAAGLNWKINTSVLWRMAWVDRHEAHRADVYRPQLDALETRRAAFETPEHRQERALRITDV